MLEEINGKLDWETGIFSMEIYAVIENRPYVFRKNIPIEEIQSYFIMANSSETTMGFNNFTEGNILDGFNISWNLEGEEENDTAEN